MVFSRRRKGQPDKEVGKRGQWVREDERSPRCTRHRSSPFSLCTPGTARRLIQCRTTGRRTAAAPCCSLMAATHPSC